MISLLTTPFILLAYTPLVVNAQEGVASGEVGRLQSLLITINNVYLTRAVAILVAIVFFYFFYILLRSMRDKGTDKDSFKLIRERLIWAVLALFVFVSLWGIILFLRDLVFNAPSGLTP